MNIRLVPVNEHNFYALMRLEVEPCQQDFVAPNDYSLAEAYSVLSAGRYVQAFGLYAEDCPVGFAMIGHNAFVNEDCPQAYRNSYYLWRLMIDRRYQGQGYGHQAVGLLLDFIRQFPDGPEETCCVSYEPENHTAKHLYARFGFVPTGEMDDDEEIAALTL